MNDRYLLDTHIWLWFFLRPEKLGEQISQILTDGNNKIVFSTVSAWEITIKQSLGKLELPTPAHHYIPNRIQKALMSVLPIQLSHTLAIAQLPPHHNDPFDRLLIAQASVEKIPVITADAKFNAYDVEIIGA